ncbi:MAG: DUF3887 domain-containing protein [Blautia sp.]|nr:DUF3887 domain-containing protein [Blautia sp.]MCM1199703.1 DUF3887 domain-containing protein [Bacteroides fragilis]
METEKYVNSIVRKIKCVGAKKKEIKNQLLSDIAMRREAGETMEQIMESMGTAAEIAEAFEQNLSKADKKAYKRRKFWENTGSIVLVLLLLCMYVWWYIPKTADISGDERFAREKITEAAKEVIELLDKEDYESLYAMSIEEIQEAMNSGTIGGVKDGISADWGKRQSIGSIYTGGIKQKGKLMAVAQVDVIYENVSVVYTITFDENRKLAGLYMR